MPSSGSEKKPVSLAEILALQRKVEELGEQIKRQQTEIDRLKRLADNRRRPRG